MCLRCREKRRRVRYLALAGIMQKARSQSHLRSLISEPRDESSTCNRRPIFVLMMGLHRSVSSAVKHESIAGLGNGQDLCISSRLHDSGRPLKEIDTPLLRKRQLIKSTHCVPIIAYSKLPPELCRFTSRCCITRAHSEEVEGETAGPAHRLTGAEQQGSCLQTTRKMLISS